MTDIEPGRMIRLVHSSHGHIIGTVKRDPRGSFVQFPGGAVDLNRMFAEGWRYAPIGGKK